jgi:hypothetical protein
MAITVTIPTVRAYSGTIPDKATQTETEFANNVYPFHLYYNNEWVPDVNATSSALDTFKTEANALAIAVNNDKDIVVEKEALVNPHYVAIDTIYSNIDNINAVNTNESNINAVNANESNININATNIDDINTASTNIADISTTATNIDDIVTAANNLSVYQNAQNAVNYKGDWIAGYETTGYSLGDVISYSDGFKYQSKVDNNLTEPTSETTTAEWFYQEVINDVRYYTKSEVDTELGLKADKATTYTKTEVDTALGLKADQSTTYTKTEVDNAITANTPYNYTTKTANYTAVAKDFIYADTSGGAFTVTLPDTPSVDDRVAIVDNTTSFSTNNLTIGRNGGTIMGIAEDMVVDIDNISFELIYNGSDWRLV